MAEQENDDALQHAAEHLALMKHHQFERRGIQQEKAALIQSKIALDKGLVGPSAVMNGGSMWQKLPASEARTWIMREIVRVERLMDALDSKIEYLQRQFDAQPEWAQAAATAASAVGSRS